MTDDSLRPCTKCGAWNPTRWYFCGSCLDYAGESFPPLPPAPAVPLPYPTETTAPATAAAPLAVSPVLAETATAATATMEIDAIVTAPAPPVEAPPVLAGTQESVNQPGAPRRFGRRLWALLRSVLTAFPGRTLRGMPEGQSAD